MLESAPLSVEIARALDYLQQTDLTTLADGRYELDGERLFAYSGDTEWTDALLPIARGADLFVCECYAFAGKLTGHMSWDVLQSRLGDLAAKRTMVTHMNPTVLARLAAARAAGVLVAEDGLTLSF